MRHTQGHLSKTVVFSAELGKAIESSPNPFQLAVAAKSEQVLSRNPNTLDVTQLKVRPHCSLFAYFSRLNITV